MTTRQLFKRHPRPWKLKRIPKPKGLEKMVGQRWELQDANGDNIGAGYKPGKRLLAVYRLTVAAVNAYKVPT